MDIILLLFFSIVIVLALISEKKRFGTPSSPLFLVTMFNLAIAILYSITALPLGYHPMIVETYVILLYGCFLFAIVSLSFSRVRCRAKTSGQQQLKYVQDYPSSGAIILAFLTIAFMATRIRTIGMNNIIEDNEFAALFGAGGLSGHVLVLQIFLATHLLGRKLTKSSIVAIAGLVFCLFLYNVKAWIIIPFMLGWFIRRDLLGMKINPLVIILVPVAIFAIFTVSYMMILGWDIENMNFIWAHFLKYVYAGIGGLNEALVGNYPVGQTPFYGLPTFIKLIFPVSTKTPSVYSYVIINDLNGEWTNVFSLFGGAYLFNGLVYGTIYILTIAVLSYMIYRQRLKTKNYWYYLAYYFWSSGLILSFFGNYYTLLNVWELTAEAFIIGIFLHSSRKKNAV